MILTQRLLQKKRQQHDDGVLGMHCMFPLWIRQSQNAWQR